MANFNEYEFNKLRAKRHAEKVKQRQEIYEIRHSNDGERKKPAYGKLLVAFIFIDCLIIQGFIMATIWETKDTSHLSSLVSLIGTLAVQAISLISYNSKSAKENTSGGIVYETALLNLENVKQPTIFNGEEENEIDPVEPHDEVEDVG